MHYKSPAFFFCFFFVNVWMSLVDACKPNLCTNGGTCVAVGSGIFTYTCLCPPDYAGLTCGVHLQRKSFNPTTCRLD